MRIGCRNKMSVKGCCFCDEQKWQSFSCNRKEVSYYMKNAPRRCATRGDEYIAMLSARAQKCASCAHFIGKKVSQLNVTIFVLAYKVIG